MEINVNTCGNCDEGFAETAERKQFLFDNTSNEAHSHSFDINGQDPFLLSCTISTKKTIRSVNQPI